MQTSGKSLQRTSLEDQAKQEKRPYVQEKETRDIYIVRLYVLQLQILVHGELYEVVLTTDLRNHHGHTFDLFQSFTERMEEG